MLHLRSATASDVRPGRREFGHVTATHLGPGVVHSLDVPRMLELGRRFCSQCVHYDIRRWKFIRTAVHVLSEYFSKTLTHFEDAPTRCVLWPTVCYSQLNDVRFARDREEYCARCFVPVRIIIVCSRARREVPDRIIRRQLVRGQWHNGSVRQSGRRHLFG